MRRYFDLCVSMKYAKYEGKSHRLSARLSIKTENKRRGKYNSLQRRTPIAGLIPFINSPSALFFLQISITSKL